ncbi:MAG: RNA polymerase sigma factor [Lachnospiraceae bacterium]|nr:RNA polymerase sigma factor [Lachnospiraceae bacterium]
MVSVDLQDYTKAVDTYADIVYRIAYSYTYTKVDSEDVLQNVFLKLFQSKQSFNSEDHLKQWLMRVTVNECHNLHRTFWKRKIHLAEIEKPVQNFLSDEEIDLHSAMLKLPSEYRIIIHMYYYEGYKTKEISKILQMKEATVRTRLARGRERLKEVLKEEWADETE